MVGGNSNANNIDELHKTSPTSLFDDFPVTSKRELVVDMSKINTIVSSKTNRMSHSAVSPLKSKLKLDNIEQTQVDTTFDLDSKTCDDIETMRTTMATPKKYVVPNDGESINIPNDNSIYDLFLLRCIFLMLSCITFLVTLLLACP